MTQTGSISPNLLFRTLRRDEASRLGSIDRAEHVDAVYRMRHGELVLEEQVEEISGWAPDELTAYVARLEELLDADGLALGAWEADGLIGLASLDLRPVGGDPTRMKLDMLYVSAGRRGHGIGRRLVEQLATQARSLGATSLYVSATPTRSTVDVYRRLGAELLASPDPALLGKEPEDIHLLLRLT
jgi:GNAT superfamily N-acetyltransferase